MKAKRKKAANTHVKAAPGYFSILRKNKAMNLEAQMTFFVPASGESVEIGLISLTNKGLKSIDITATAAIPVFGRSADNLRDHRQVTTLLGRVIKK